ncbi:MAG: PEP-CTERM sorting domain-containing protein [Acidobacteria bacterium]|nr:PEP-CTERM sorting domain-containing protein [Acidobacteriota bacterium]
MQKPQRSVIISARISKVYTLSTQKPVAIPEPATMLLLGTGIAGITIRVCKRRKSV